MSFSFKIKTNQIYISVVGNVCLGQNLLVYCIETIIGEVNCNEGMHSLARILIVNALFLHFCHLPEAVMKPCEFWWKDAFVYQAAHFYQCTYCCYNDQRVNKFCLPFKGVCLELHWKTFCARVVLKLLSET